MTNYLTNILNELNYTQLQIHSKQGLIGCPFRAFFGGTINYNPHKGSQYTRLENESLCSKLCGSLFPRAYWPETCPCHRVKTPGYVKHRFWRSLNKATCR